MSFPIEKEAWALIESGRFDLSIAEKFVLVKVAFLANNERECWHGTAGLAGLMGISKSTVSDALKKLNKLGILSKRPRPQPEGRGRATNAIIFEAADSDSHHVSIDDQIRIDGAADSEVDPQQIRNQTNGTNKGTGKALENSLESREEAAVGNRRRNLPLPSVGRLKVTEHELSLAAAALAEFNLRNCSRLKLLGRANGATESLKRIVERLRENEEITAEELRSIVELSFQNPYWSGPAKVGNIFGPKAFQGAIVNDGIARSSRTVRRDIDRKGSGRKGPDW